jgi:hypothetical protein
MIKNVGDYAYYWFASNITVFNPNITWEFVVAVGLDETLSDVDLYVSMFDGRNPTSIDFDFQSTNQGADDILIKYNDPFFTSSNYNTSNGMLFVVGVKALTPKANFTIIMNGPVRLSA